MFRRQRSLTSTLSLTRHSITSQLSALQVLSQRCFTKPRCKEINEYLTIDDFDREAKIRLPDQKLAYLRSGADGQITLRRNRQIYDTMMLKPRVCVDVTTVNTQQTILGHSIDFPLFVSPTGLNKLFHPNGEAELAKACGNKGVPHMISSCTDTSWEEIKDGKVSTKQVMWYQVYFDTCKDLMMKEMGKAIDSGCTAVFVTVDCPFCGKRVSDQRSGAAFGLNHSACIDPSVSWDSINWLQRQAQRMRNDIHFGIKGVQCGEDAVLAVKNCDLDAIVVSNHGGRQLDTVPSSIEMLSDVVSALNEQSFAKTQNNVEIMVDGGIRRGSDIFKAVCLGAKAVGIGRPALYGLTCHGSEGVQKVFDILHQELDLTMKLVGCVDIQQASEQFLW